MSGALATSRASHRAGPDRESRRPIKLMIVDDSMVARAVLSRMIDADGNFEIAGIAGTAEDAIEALGQVMVDIVVLDLEMPGVGGLKALPRILEAAKGAKVLIVSSLAEEGAEETVAALALGAADTLPKPGTGRFNGRFSEVLLSKLRGLGYADRSSVRPSQPASLPQVIRPQSSQALRLVAIGASTGGIQALGAFFAALPARIGVPILVTQHLPPAFMTVFARQLSVAAGREAVVAQDGTQLLPDCIVIAPGEAHMLVDEVNGLLIARLLKTKVSSGCMPSVDPMLASAGAVLGGGALGIVLTGMGRDGAEGARKLIEAGGSVMAQDESTSAVWGMPRAVAELGLACAVLSPDKLARRVGSRAEEGPCK
ncbi:chemotaxis-specific protein-glutamate methyltransferase CheB [Sphingomonas sp. NSE70-1]|uniref:Protein-glutamate methylesterase/protein-glutamine glutaminase n=1 Tax=Sphingomonas caseinilyticus TaxID=2908205 RepID=A0ABT0RRN2_9SPHN|nr:chemotaxis-specific protein-glutamate methyltransferase CheB [Sphingomonas caseinilyticus]MCL6697668.1 chemotaxis-specific protein-glutamate methyltransferase CheB [Sphingomonas caseinilyticus]